MKLNILTLAGLLLTTGLNAELASGPPDRKSKSENVQTIPALVIPPNGQLENPTTSLVLTKETKEAGLTPIKEIKESNTTPTKEAKESSLTKPTPIEPKESNLKPVLTVDVKTSTSKSNTASPTNLADESLGSLENEFDIPTLLTNQKAPTTKGEKLSDSTKSTAASKISTEELDAKSSSGSNLAKTASSFNKSSASTESSASLISNTFLPILPIFYYFLN
ncbi:hypothetical protein K502DRAFT_366624 [Neoconidiobolus thromboides FSU 785]|nr:hypothetical protein K502DRAFT_366624 [Neoconidiobolus thromboides FSU 785]